MSKIISFILGLFVGYIITTTIVNNVYTPVATYKDGRTVEKNFTTGDTRLVPVPTPTR